MTIAEVKNLSLCEACKITVAIFRELCSDG